MRISAWLVTLGVVVTGAGSACTESTAPTLLEGPPPGVEPQPGEPPTASAPGYYIHLADPSGKDLGRLARGWGPTWSPDGSEIAFQHMGQNGANSGIFVMDVGGTAGPRLGDGEKWLPRWSPDGSKIAFLTCIPNGVVGPFDGCDMTFGVINADGSGERMIGRTGLSGGIPPADWSPDGRRIAFVGGEGDRADVHVVDADGGGLAKLTELGTVTGVDWSPDGRMIAFRAAESVYVMNIDGSGLATLTDDTDRVIVRDLEWSPQGDRVAFSMSPSRFLDGVDDPASLTVHVVDADGTNRIEVATHALGPRWLPDGRTLSFRRWLVDGVWTVSADGGEASMVLSDAFEAEWSPDGTRIAYVRHVR